MVLSGALQSTVQYSAAVVSSAWSISVILVGNVVTKTSYYSSLRRNAFGTWKLGICSIVLGNFIFAHYIVE